MSRRLTIRPKHTTGGPPYAVTLKSQGGRWLGDVGKKGAHWWARDPQGWYIKALFRTRDEAARALDEGRKLPDRKPRRR